MFYEKRIALLLNCTLSLSMVIPASILEQQLRFELVLGAFYRPPPDQ